MLHLWDISFRMCVCAYRAGHCVLSAALGQQGWKVESQLKAGGDSVTMLMLRHLSPETQTIGALVLVLIDPTKPFTR